MPFSKKSIACLVLLAVTIIALPIIYLFSNKEPSKVLAAKSKPDYTLVFVGDSMTEYLGNFDELRTYLKDYFPDKEFLLLNYGFGSTNILSVPDRLEKDSTHSGRIFKPIIDIPYDMIFIESFGHNPLSELPLEEGLQKQNQTLDQITTILTQKQPKQKIVFIATIAPNKREYAQGVVDLTPEKREQWVNEREAYIKNHIAYANSHQIPLINIYNESLNWEGTGDLELISSTDHIHPSPKGVYFISQQISKFIYENKNLLK